METTPDAAIAANVARLRRDRGDTVRALSDKLGDLGRPILPSGITKIEGHQRKVSAGDLVALALALQVTPNALLLPASGDAALTPEVTKSLADAWRWALTPPAPENATLASARDLAERVEHFCEDPTDENRERVHRGLRVLAAQVEDLLAPQPAEMRNVLRHIRRVPTEEYEVNRKDDDGER